MKLDLYFARRFLTSFVLITIVFLTLMMLIDFVDQVRRFKGTSTSVGQLFHLTLLNAPRAISEILPLIMILSSVVMFVGLARSSELVVTRAIGRSGLRVLVAPIVVTALLGGLAVTMLNPIVASTSDRYEQLLDTYKTGRVSTLSISGEGLWLRQGSEAGQSVIHAESYDTETDTLGGVTILAFSTDGNAVRQVIAQEARLENGSWQLSNVKMWPLETGVSPESKASYHDTLRIETSLTRERIQDTLGQPGLVSIYEMQDTIAQLSAAGFSTRQYEVWFQAELARPFFLVAMALIGAAFTMRHVRLGGTGIAVLTSVLLGFALYFVRNFARVLGENGQLPVELAAWAPPAAAILLATGLLLHAEDG